MMVVGALVAVVDAVPGRGAAVVTSFDMAGGQGGSIRSFRWREPGSSPIWRRR